MNDLVWLFQRRSFVLSREHENQNVATIGTLLDQFMLSLNKNVLPTFHSVCHVFDRDKRRTLKKEVL